MGVHHCASILFVLFSFAVMQQVICDKIYILPSDQHCQADLELVMGMQCLTLQQYANGSNFLIDNQTLMLAPGTHYLWTNLTASGTNMTAFEIYGTDAIIHCNHTGDDEGVYIQHFHYVNISGINFGGCKSILFQSIHTLVIADSGLLQLSDHESYSHYADYWNLSHILNAALLRMTFCCKHNILQVEWSSLAIKQSVFNVAVARMNHTDILITKSNFTEFNYESAVYVENGSMIPYSII